MSERRLTSLGSDMERKFGHFRAVVDNEWVFVSGITGFDCARDENSNDAAEQIREMLRNIERALSEAAAELADVVRALHRSGLGGLAEHLPGYRRDIRRRQVHRDGDNRRLL